MLEPRTRTDAGGDAALAEPPTFIEATKVWARIGCLSFGGPAGQIALMHRILVDERRWISEERFLHALNFCMLLPGPEAQQLATYVGWLLHGRRGGVVAGTLFVLPGLVVMLVLSSLYLTFHRTDWLPGVFLGLKAAVLAVVVIALVRVAGRAIKSAPMAAIAITAFLALFAFHIPFPLVVLAAGIAGAALHGLRGPPATSAVPPARLDRPWRAAAITLVTWGAIWIAPVALIALIRGPGDVLVTLGLFFSKMAVVTFGGAYAVLAWVAQEAVEVRGWLLPGEMLDGLALAETTPGPLILTLTHVGFLASARTPGSLPPLAAGLIGAGLTAWVTFAPSFLWIFLGGPHVERLRHNRLLSAALAAITAAVVGVMANLAAWFALHVVFAQVDEVAIGPASLPSPAWATIHVAPIAIAIVAWIALARLKWPLVPVLAGCGLAGYAAGLVGG